MENQVQTIVCPNCGASAKNLHNCEYCGSFLIQRAAEGKDVSNYVQHSQTIKTEGIDGVIKHYFELVDRFSPAYLHLPDIFLDVVINGYHQFSLWGSNEWGGIRLEFDNENLGSAAQRFYDLPVYEAFSKVPYYELKFFGLIKKLAGYTYRIDMGYDYKGAANLLMQLVKEVFQADEKNTLLEIYVPVDEDAVPDSITYTLHGDVVERSGAGQNDFETMAPSRS